MGCTREEERGGTRRCGHVRPPDEATSQRRVDNHYALHLLPSPPAAQPNIGRGCTHGADRSACRSGCDGARQSGRTATEAARERRAPLCTPAQPLLGRTILGNCSTNRCLCSCTPGRPPSLHAGCVGRVAFGGNDARRPSTTRPCSSGTSLSSCRRLPPRSPASSSRGMGPTSTTHSSSSLALRSGSSTWPRSILAPSRPMGRPLPT